MTSHEVSHSVGREVLAGRGSRTPGARRRPRLLILSFSPIVSDARVLKQVRLLSTDYELTTCGYGEAPAGVAHHVRIPDELVSWRLDRPLVMARRFERAQAAQEVVAWAREHLAPGDYDVVLAMVNQGLGYALLPELAVRSSNVPDGVSIARLPGLGTRQLAVRHRSVRGEPGPATRAALDVLLQQAASLDMG